MDGGDQFMIPDTVVIRLGHGAKFEASITGFQGFHELGAMGEQAIIAGSGINTPLG